jgi:hypothetical protein
MVTVADAPGVMLGAGGLAGVVAFRGRCAVARKKNTCAYCGGIATTREHVVPEQMYARSIKEKTQLLTIPSCEPCNNQWCDDEVHFRNVITAAGPDPDAARMEVWANFMRSLEQVDGKRRLTDFFSLTTRTNEKPSRMVIYPGKDPRVLRIACKVARGLTYHHFGEMPAEGEVAAALNTVSMPVEVVNAIQWWHRDPAVLSYAFIPGHVYPKHLHLRTVWFLIFGGRVAFNVVVTRPGMKPGGNLARYWKK